MGTLIAIEPNASAGGFINLPIDPSGYHMGAMGLFPGGFGDAARKAVGKGCVTKCITQEIPEWHIASFIGAAPIPKKPLGFKKFYGASDYTNPISIAGFVLGQVTGNPKISKTFRIIGRVNRRVAPGLAVYDLIKVLVCTVDCTDGCSK